MSLFTGPEFIHVGGEIYVNVAAIKKIRLSRPHLLDDIEFPSQQYPPNFDGDYVELIEFAAGGGFVSAEYKIEVKYRRELLKEIAPQLRRLLGIKMKTI